MKTVRKKNGKKIQEKYTWKIMIKNTKKKGRNTGKKYGKKVQGKSTEEKGTGKSHVTSGDVTSGQACRGGYIS